MMESQQNEIYNITQKILVKLASTLETSSGKAMLAKLRNSIGKSTAACSIQVRSIR